jgi:hypothetical protein
MLDDEIRETGIMECWNSEISTPIIPLFQYSTIPLC